MAYGVYLADSIDSAELKTDSVKSAKIQASAVEAAEIASDAVITAKILDANVTLAKVENVASGQIIVGNGSARPTAVAISGDIALAAGGAMTIQATAVEGTMLNANVADTSTIQVSSNTLSVLKVPNALTAGDGISAGGTFDGAAARTLDITPAQTTITSVKNDALVVGRASGNDHIDFASAGNVKIMTNNVARLSVADASVTVGNDLVVTGDLTVNGTTTTVATANLLVEDKLVTLNDGGGVNSAGGSGIEFEEDGSISGFIKVASDRAGFEFQAPGNANTLTIDATAVSTITVAADSAINQDVQSTASPSFAGLSLAAGAADILIDDDNAAALEIKEGGNAYITCDTTNSSEAVKIGTKLSVAGEIGFLGAGRLSLLDNQGSALDITEGGNSYMKFVTTNTGEKVQMFKGIDFATAGENALSIPDNQADALTIKEGGSFYMKFVTSNGAEKVQMHKGIDFAIAGENALTIPGNQADALTIKEGNNFYMKFVSTTGGEKIDAMKGFGVMRYCKQIATADGSGQSDAVGITAGKALALITSDGAGKGVKLPTASSCEEGEYILVASAVASTAAFKLYAEDTAGKISGVDSVSVPVGGSVGCVLIDKTNKKWILV